MMTTKRMVYMALLSAVVFISTFIVKVPIPNGYVHLGDAAVFLCGYILGPVFGGIAAAIGAGSADYFSGYAVYILPTLIAKSSMARITGRWILNAQNTKKQYGTMLIAIVLMCAVYYIAEVFMLGSISAPLINVPFNALQALVGLVVFLLLRRPFSAFRLED